MFLKFKQHHNNVFVVLISLANPFSQLQQKRLLSVVDNFGWTFHGYLDVYNLGPGQPKVRGVLKGGVQGEGVFLGNPKDSVWEGWGTLGNIRGD